MLGNSQCFANLPVNSNKFALQAMITGGMDCKHSQARLDMQSLQFLPRGCTYQQSFSLWHLSVWKSNPFQPTCKESLSLIHPNVVSPVKCFGFASPSPSCFLFLLESVSCLPLCVFAGCGLLFPSSYQSS